MLITSNFSFSHSVFKRLVLQTCKKKGLFGKGLTLYQAIARFNEPEKGSLIFPSITFHFPFKKIRLRPIHFFQNNISYRKENKFCPFQKNHLCTVFQNFNTFPNKPSSLRVCCINLLKKKNTVGNEEIAHNEQFLLFPQCFLPFWRTFCKFYRIQKCRLPTPSVPESLKFDVQERGKPNLPFNLHH